MGYPIAIQLYSVRDDVAANMYGALKKIKELGYDGVEFAGLYEHKPAEIREMCADIGLTPISAHVAYLEMMADPDGVIGAYAEIGCKFIAVPYLNSDLRPGTEKFPEVLENIRMLGGVCKKYGITLQYHNHDFEFCKLDGKYGLDVMYETIPADLLQTQLDLCWVNVGGEDPAEYLLKYKDRAPTVHFKDFAGEKSENMYELIGIKNTAAPKRPANFEYRPNGYGNQNFPKILESVRKTNAGWIIVEQDNPSMGLTPLECAKKSIDYLKSIGV